MEFNNLLTWLRENYEPCVAESAEENIRKYCVEEGNDTYPNLSKLLINGFIWNDTKEGHAFWENVYEELLDLEKRS